MSSNCIIPQLYLQYVFLPPGRGLSCDQLFRFLWIQFGFHPVSFFSYHGLNMMSLSRLTQGVISDLGCRVYEVCALGFYDLEANKKSARRELLRRHTKMRKKPAALRSQNTLPRAAPLSWPYYIYILQYISCRIHGTFVNLAFWLGDQNPSTVFWINIK